MVHSIAFYPAVIAITFLALAIVMVFFDSSEAGKSIKANWELLRLRDASTARSIISAITGGVISLTVFSFSMVMIVLNQAASQMSNRILDKLIGNRFQQFVLGFYIGTIVYSLFLLSTIRDIDDGIYVPSLSTYLLILLTVMDIFLFIYFLHYITQSVKYEIIIDRIHDQTKKALVKTCRLQKEPVLAAAAEGYIITATKSGIFSGLNKKGLLSLAVKNDCRFSFLHPLGTYLLKDVPFLTVSGEPGRDIEELKDDLLVHVFISREENIEDDFNYGFRQLMEVAVKALSPGINDPGTAITSLRSLADLLAYRLKYYPANTTCDEKGIIRLVTKEHSFEQIFAHALFPIWDYGKKDRMVQEEMRQILTQLEVVQHHPAIGKLLVAVQKQQTAMTY
jgi:uncharacterized membrane protein